MLGGRPLPHVITTLRHQPQNGVRTEAMDLGKIRPEQRIQLGPRIKLRLVLGLGVPHRRQWFRRRRAHFVQRTQDLLDLGVAFRNLGLVEIVESRGAAGRARDDSLRA